jgi:hypothetical protein
MSLIFYFNFFESYDCFIDRRVSTKSNQASYAESSICPHAEGSYQRHIQAELQVTHLFV